MPLTQRTRIGIPKQRHADKAPGRPLRKKIEIAIIVSSIVGAVFYVVFVVVNVRADFAENRAAAAAEAAAEAAEPKQERTSRFQVNSDMGTTVGNYMGHMAGASGRAYPSDSQIEQMAKTSAVDAGSTVNDIFFRGAFKRAFTSGFKQGRRL